LKQQKQYYKDNAPRILEQRKQYQKDNTLRILKYQKQWNKDNVPKKAKYNKQWHKDNTEYRKQYNKDNAPRITEQRKQYNKDNVSQIKQYRKDNALFESYFKKLEVFEEIRPCLENLKLLEVKCAYCGKWTKPTNLQVKNRLQSFNGTNAGESRFYCSENCKQSCPIYNKIKWPRGFKKATSREVVPLLRQLVLERDGYTCQKCGATTETAQLHVHHEKSYTLNKVMANDPDNCITLCKDCHKQVHSREGCKYSDLKC
jgi:5-methylcytosine-specific restriction endonuclease McrA